jgi:hypothetical protein
MVSSSSPENMQYKYSAQKAYFPVYHGGIESYNISKNHCCQPQGSLEFEVFKREYEGANLFKYTNLQKDCFGHVEFTKLIQTKRTTLNLQCSVPKVRLKRA